MPIVDGLVPSASSGTLSSIETPERVDIVVSHEAPLSFAPLPMRADYVRDVTWQKIVESRKYLDYVLQIVKPTFWFYGHYHCHYEGNCQNTLYRCLDIAEMTQVV